MILTGKAKEDFEKWLFNHNIYAVKEIARYGGYCGTAEFEPTIDDVYYDLPETLQYAIIQEWFDSVGIYIMCSNAKAFVNSSVLNPYFNNRNEALKHALTNANEIYNGNKNRT